VRWVFPHSYYYLGSLANPPKGFNDIPDWQIDMNWINRGARAERWNRFATAQNQIAHLNKDQYVPGRASPGGASDEAPGKTWGGGQCLFIDDVEFVVLDVVGNEDGTSETKQHIASMSTADSNRKLMEITGSQLINRYGRSQPGDAYRNALNRAGIKWDKAGDCPSAGPGPRCPQVAVWAYAAPASCSIWPF
jgi:hypothetical protein